MRPLNRIPPSSIARSGAFNGVAGAGEGTPSLNDARILPGKPAFEEKWSGR